MQALLVLPGFWKLQRCALLLVACVFGFTEPRIILEVDTYASNKTQADTILNCFFLVSLLTVRLIFNYQVIEKLASTQPNLKHLSQVLDWWRETCDSRCLPIMRLLSEETSKWVHRCVDLVTAGKTIRENMLEHVTEHCHAPLLDSDTLLPPSSICYFFRTENNSHKSNATQPSAGWEFWSNTKYGISLN